MDCRVFSFLSLLITTYCLAQAPAIQWQKCYGGTGIDNANCIELTSDGGYIVAGYTASNNGDITSNHGSNDGWIIKLSNNGTIEWQKTYGGSFDDQFSKIKQTSDGGYIVAGVSNSNNGDITNYHGDKDVWILKIDSGGTIQWQKKYGGDDAESAYAIQQTTDGGYIVAGQTYSYDNNIMPVNGDVVGFHGFIDGWIIKLDNAGVIQWQKCLGGIAGDNEETILSIEQTTDGGYIASGHATFYWLVKMNNLGTTEWQAEYDWDVSRDAIQTADGGFIMVGDAVTQIGNSTGHNFGVIKTDAFGNIVWRYSYGGDGFFDIASKVRQTADGGYVVTGVTNSSYSGNVTGTGYGLQDVWVIKLSSTGVLQWQKPMGGSSYDSSSDIKITPDRGYIVAGSAQSTNGNVTGNHGAADLWVVKLAPDALGLDDHIITSTVIYPNPAKNKINFSEEVLAVSIYTIDGKLIQNALINGKEMDISGLVPGIYMIQTQTQNGFNNSKFIKE